MDVSIELNYENPVFSEEEVCKMTTESLEDFWIDVLFCSWTKEKSSCFRK